MLYSSYNRYEYWWHLKPGFYYIFYESDSDANENYSDLPLNKAQIILQGMVIHVSKTMQETNLKFDIEQTASSLSFAFASFMKEQDLFPNK